MPTTAEKIESILDAGVFERLGIRVLKEIDQDRICRPSAGLRRHESRMHYENQNAQ
jgi:hypothetical protein